MKKLVPVEELRFGMFIAELDRPWVGTPFAFQGFTLTNERELEFLRRCCKQVYVDPEKGSIDITLPQFKPGAGAAALEVRGSSEYRVAETIQAELPRAGTIHAETARVLAEAFRAARAGDPLDGRVLRHAVEGITDSVIRNPDALVLIERMRAKGEQVFTRAIGVSVYMVVFGRFLQLPRYTLDRLGLLGLLQDIGKTRIPDELLAKTGKLTPAELAVARSHVKYSVEILKQASGLPVDLPDLALLHHERWGGTGYPRGLKRNEIGLYGSIAGLVDCFDALTAARPYADQLSPSNALNMLYKLRDVEFHGALVEQFIQCIGIFPVGSIIEMSTGEVGIVVSQNLVRRLQPRVMLVQDAAGHPLRPAKLLDLLKDPMAGPQEPYRIRRTLEYGKVQVDPRELFL